MRLPRRGFRRWAGNGLGDLKSGQRGKNLRTSASVVESNMVGPTAPFGAAVVQPPRAARLGNFSPKRIAQPARNALRPGVGLRRNGH